MIPFEKISKGMSKSTETGMSVCLPASDQGASVIDWHVTVAFSCKQVLETYCTQDLERGIITAQCNA